MVTLVIVSATEVATAAVYFACLLWQRCAEAVHDHGATTVPLSASSQISLSRGPPWTGSLSYILREQECRGGHCVRSPPVVGADGSGA